MVRFTAPGVEFDPGGIGNCFAGDAAVALLRDDHVQAALLSAGGSKLYALGAPSSEPGWKIVIPGPLPLHTALSTVYLRDTLLSSADCSQKHFIANGREYCHIMDPRTVRPVEGRVQVSIIDRSATANDAHSNVLFVDRPEQSLGFLAASRPHASALIVSTSRTPGSGLGHDLHNVSMERLCRQKPLLPAGFARAARRGVPQATQGRRYQRPRSQEPLGKELPQFTAGIF